MKWILRPFRRLILQSKLASVVSAEFEAKQTIVNCINERCRLERELKALS